MKEAVVEAQEIIMDSALADKIDEIYLSTIDEGDYNANKTIILIKNVNVDTAMRGNNDFYGLKRKIEVQVFFASETDEVYIEFETKLIKLMLQNKWLMPDIYTVDVDPEENVRYSTFYFVKQEQIDFE